MNRLCSDAYEALCRDYRSNEFLEALDAVVYGNGKNRQERLSLLKKAIAHQVISSAEFSRLPVHKKAAAIGEVIRCLKVVGIHREPPGSIRHYIF